MANIPCVYGSVAVCFGLLRVIEKKKLKDDPLRFMSLINIASWIPIIGSIIAGIIHVSIRVKGYREAHDQKWQSKERR